MYCQNVRFTYLKKERTRFKLNFSKFMNEFEKIHARTDVRDAI